MSKKQEVEVAFSPVTGKIYAGKMKRYPDGHAGFTENRQDVTRQCAFATAMMLAYTSQAFCFEANGMKLMLVVQKRDEDESDVVPEEP